jgi:hypothetical protein
MNFRFEGQTRVELKVAFIQKVRFIFQISKNKHSKLLSWAWNLNFLFTVIGGKFKFQVQDSDLEYLFWEVWRFEKHIALSEKKQPLYISCYFLSYENKTKLRWINEKGWKFYIICNLLSTTKTALAICSMFFFMFLSLFRSIQR